MALSKKYPIVRMALFFVLNILDMATTYCFVSLDGNTRAEGNPMARWLINQGWGYVILAKFFGVILVLATIVYIYSLHQRIGNIVATALVVIFFLIVINNSIYLINQFF